MDDPEQGEVRGRGEAGEDKRDQKESDQRRTRKRSRKLAWTRRDNEAKSRVV